MRTSFAHTVLSAAAAAAAAVPPAGFDFPAFVILAANASSGSNGENPPTDDSYNLNTKFNPSMAIIVVVLLTAFFFMAFFSIYVRKCGEESDLGRGIGAIGAGGVGERRENVAQGLERSVIESFPVFTYELVKGLKTQYQYKEIQECAVCLNDFEDNESLRLLPKCGHAFHPECIDMWLCSHITCPVCRTNLVPDDIANPTGTAYGVVEPRPEPVPNADVTVIPRVSGSLHGSSRSRSTRRMELSGSLHLPIPSPTLTPTPTPMPPPQVEEPVPAAPKPPRPVPSPVTVPERLSVKFDLESIKPDSDADADADGANLIRSHSTGHSLVRMRKETGATEWFISTPKGLAPAVHLTCTFVKVPLHSRSQGPSARFSKLPFSLSVGRSPAFNASGGDGNGSVSGSLRRWYDRRIRSPLSGGGVVDYGNFPRSRSEHRPAPPCVFNPENTNLGPEQQAAASTVPDARDAAKIYLRSLRRTIKRLTGRENGTGAGDNVVSDPSSQRGSSRGHDSGSVGSAYPPTHATV